MAGTPGSGWPLTTLGGSGGTGQNRRPDGGEVAARLRDEPEVGAELVEGDAPGRVAGRGDHRLAAEGQRDPAGQFVGPARVRADHRDSVAQGLVDAHHARVGALAAEQRRQQPNRRAHGQEAHDCVALGERAR